MPRVVKIPVSGFQVITPFISKRESQVSTATTKKQVPLWWQGQADQKYLHNLEEETEMDEKMQTQKCVRNLPHTGLQIPLEHFKETCESNTEWRFSSSICHPLTLIPNSESPHGYGQPRWYTVLMAASLITCFPFPSRPKDRFPWATDRRHNTRTTAVSQPKGPFSSVHRWPATVAKPSQNR